MTRLRQYTRLGTTGDIPQELPANHERFKIAAITASLLCDATAGTRNIFLEVIYGGVILIQRIPIQFTSLLVATAQGFFSMGLALSDNRTDDAVNQYYTSTALPEIWLDSKCTARLIVQNGQAGDLWSEISWLLEAED